MNEITSIDDISNLIRNGETDWEKYGRVRIARHPEFPLISFCYNQIAFFGNDWNWFEEHVRGIIFNSETGELVSRPMKKFFNYGEHGIAPKGEIYCVQDKLDGSLGIPYLYGDNLYFATKGSFESEQAKWATDWINDPSRVYLRDQIFDLLKNGFTPVFEIIYPENRIVVDYKGREDLVLLCVIHNESGDELFEDENGYYWSGNVVEYKHYTLDEMIKLAEDLPLDHEGWVVTFEDRTKVKIKGVKYLRVHKLISTLSFSSVLDARRNNIFEQMIDGIPDEFLSTVMAYSNLIDETIEQISDYLSIIIKQAPVQEPGEEYRAYKKRYAEWANSHGRYNSYLFAIEAGKDILPIIYNREFENISLTPE